MSKVRIFPHCIVRAWVVIEVEGGFVGVFKGDRDPADDGPLLTEEGPLHLIMNALLRPEVRQGLPIVSHEDPYWMKEAVA